MSQIVLNTTLANEAWFVAKTQLDVTEEKGNRGAVVRKYLKSVGLPEGNAWCASFVFWCVKMACEKLNLPVPLVKTGGVLDQYNRTTCRKVPAITLLSMSIDEPFIFAIDHGGGLGHMGFGKIKSKGLVETIEGNSNDEGSREGYEVCQRERAITEFKGIILLP
jgi:hypothetical protein